MRWLLSDYVLSCNILYECYPTHMLSDHWCPTLIKFTILVFIFFHCFHIPILSLVLTISSSNCICLLALAIENSLPIHLWPLQVCVTPSLLFPQKAISNGTPEHIFIFSSSDSCFIIFSILTSERSDSIFFIDCPFVTIT